MPLSVPVLVVGNFRDAGNREVTETEARSFIRRVAKARQVASTSASTAAPEGDALEMQGHQL